MITKKEKKSTDEEVVFEDESDTAKSVAEKTKKALKVCEKEKKEYLDGWKRAKADALNEKKRQKNLIHQERTNQIIQCAAGMLPILDSIRTALEKETRNNTTQDGIKQIYTQCQRSFTDIGVTIIDSVGEAFDPHQHQSVGEQKVTEKEEDNTVVEVMRVGARIKEMVIRPAMVRIGIYKKSVDKAVDKNT